MFNKNKKYNKGVTLLELMVVVSIILILTAVSIADYGQFKSSIALQNLSDDIALSIRKAQGLAIGVEKANNSFNRIYGIQFNTTSSKDFYIFSEDKDSGNKIYDGDVLIERLTIKGTNSIQSIYCGGTSKNLVNITFSRPNLEPTFYSSSTKLSCDYVKITVKNNSYPKTKDIYIYKNGQISSY